MDTPTTSNVTITIKDDIPPSFYGVVLVTITNANGTLESFEVRILKPILDYLKSQNYTKAQIVSMLNRNNAPIVF